MKSQGSIFPVELPSDDAVSAIDVIIRSGARRALQAAIEFEVEEFIERHRELRDHNGRHAIVRNGWREPREIATVAGTIPIEQPRVRDRRSAEERLEFSSAILPRYARKSKSLEVLVPVLYLKGIASGDMAEALEAILGPNAPGLSAATVTRLLEQWQTEFTEWSRRDLSGSQYVYLWVDGIYTNVRLTDERPCALVLIGATSDGRKELLGIVDGERESSQSWKEILLDLKKRGMTTAPMLAIADGALGFWKALSEVYPSTREQLCWVHKTANVLNALPKKLHAAAKKQVQEIYQSETRADALKEFRHFEALYGAKYPKAVATIAKHLNRLLTFYDFPAEHWQHIRSTNVIESAFSTIRHRQRQTKGNGSRRATLAMIFKLGLEAQKSWRRLTAPERLQELLAGGRFVDGVPKTPQTDDVEPPEPQPLLELEVTA